MAPLQGIGVLVTRPEQQSLPLCRMLEAEGAMTLRLPAIAIEPCGELPEWRGRAGPLEQYDIIVFTSANAVRFALPLLDTPGDLELAAIGPATARALRERGHQVLQPQAGYTSEDLLAHPRFTSLAGRRVLLIKGAGGRPLLERAFTGRGARVVSLDVYRRIAAAPSAAQLASVLAAFEADRLHVVTATSLEIGRRLLAMSPALRPGLQRLHWLVPGERVAAGLQESGLHARIVIAPSAEDHELLSALLHWRSHGPPA